MTASLEPTILTQPIEAANLRAAHAPIPSLYTSTLWASGIKPKQILPDYKTETLCTVNCAESFDRLRVELSERKHTTVVLDLDYVGRSREGLSFLKEFPQPQANVILLVRNGRSLSTETLQAIAETKAEVRWDFSALLRHKIELYQQAHGLKTMGSVAEKLGIEGSTISAHLNRDIAIQSLTLEKICTGLGISPEERAQCFNLRLLGMDVERRQEARVAAQLSIEQALAKAEGKYPGDHRVLEKAAEYFPEYTRGELISVVREERKKRGLSDPFEVLHDEVRKLHDRLGELHTPEWERRRMRQLTGFILEEMALLTRQLRGVEQCSQFCATVQRDAKGEITSTRNILDLVVLEPEQAPNMWRKLFETAVQEGRLSQIDQGEIIVEVKKDAQSGTLILRYHPRGLPEDQAIVVGTQTFQLSDDRKAAIIEMLPPKAWAVRYQDHATGKQVFSHGWSTFNRFNDGSIGEFMSDPRSRVDEEVLWDKALPYCAIELKKGGGRSASYVASIVDQLKAQSEAILQARENEPNSVLGMIGHIKVMVLEDNPELSEAISKLCNEKPMFSYERFRDYAVHGVVDKLNNGEYSLPEIVAMHRFFRMLNEVLAQKPSIQSFSEFRSLVPHAIDSSLYVDPAGGSEELSRELTHRYIAPTQGPARDFLISEAKGDLLAKLKKSGEQSEVLDKVKDALTSFSNLIQINPRIGWNDLQEIILQRFPRAEESGFLNPGLGARIEENGQIKTIRRVFARGAGSEQLDADIMAILAEYDIDGQSIAPDDSDKLIKLIEQLRGAVSSREIQINRRRDLEITLGTELLGNKLHRLLPSEADHKAGIEKCYRPVGFSPLAEVRRSLINSSDISQLEEEALLGELAYALILRAGPDVRSKVFGDYSRSVEVVIYDALRTTNAPMGIAEQVVVNEALAKAEYEPTFTSGFSLSARDSKSSPVREVVPILTATKDFGNQLAKFSRNVLSTLDSHDELTTDTLLQWREQLLRVKSSFSHVLEYNPAQNVQSVFERNTGPTPTLPVKFFHRIFDELAVKNAELVDPAIADQMFADQMFDHETFADFEKSVSATMLPVSEEAKAKVSKDLMEVLVREAGYLRDGERSALAAAVITRALGIEERMTLSTLDRALWNSTILSEVSPKLAHEYLQVTLTSFLHNPQVYRDFYLSSLEEVVGNFSARCLNDSSVLPRFADVVQLRARERGQSDSVAKYEILSELVTAHLLAHDPFEGSDHRLNLQMTPMQAINICTGKGEVPIDEVPKVTTTASRVTGEKIDALLRLDTRSLAPAANALSAQIGIINTYLADPHAWHSRGLNSREVDRESVRDHGDKFWVGKKIRELYEVEEASRALLHSLNDSSRGIAETQTLMFSVHIDMLRRQKGEKGVEELKTLMRKWMEVTADQIAKNPFLQNLGPTDLKQDHFRGFRNYGEFGKIIQALVGEHFPAYLFYVFNAGMYAKFCEYELRTLPASDHFTRK